LNDSIPIISEELNLKRSSNKKQLESNVSENKENIITNEKKRVLKSKDKEKKKFKSEANKENEKPQGMLVTDRERKTRTNKETTKSL